MVHYNGFLTCLNGMGEPYTIFLFIISSLSWIKSCVFGTLKRRRPGQVGYDGLIEWSLKKTIP